MIEDHNRAFSAATTWIHIRSRLMIGSQCKLRVFSMHKDDLRSLWAAVLVTVVRDLTSPTQNNARDRRAAEDWVGTYPSQDFRKMVSLAGHDPDALWPWFRDFIALPVAVRKARSGLRSQGPNERLSGCIFTRAD